MGKDHCVQITAEERLQLLKDDFKRIQSNLKIIMETVKYCGICFSSGREHTFSKLDFTKAVIGNTRKISLEQMVRDVFGNQIVTDIISKFICSECAEEVKKFFLFRNRVKNNSLIVEKFIVQIDEQINDVCGLVDSSTSLDITNAIISIQGFAPPEPEVILPTDTKPFICDHCGACFSKKGNLGKHVDMKHRSKRRVKVVDPLTCPECPDASKCIHEKYVTSFRVQKEHGMNLTKCLGCEFECDKIAGLIAHVNRNHLRINPYLCDSCGRSFPSKTSQLAHIKRYHTTADPTCQYCDEEFSSKEKLALHIKKCESLKRKFACNSCPASFNTEQGLRVHQKKHENVFQCTMCYRAFRTEMLLQRHRHDVHEAVIKPIKKKLPPIRQCSICHATFKNNPELKSHMSTHRPNEKHHCKVCDKYFDQRKTYLQHQLCPSHIRRINPKANFTFSCDLCDGVSYKSFKNLENHRNVVHLKIKPYSCEKCGKQFTTPTHLRYHMQAHSDVKKFRCNVCSTMLTTMSGLKKHKLRYHSDKKPFPCEKCNQSFVCKSVLVLHNMKAHSPKTVPCPICKSKFSHRTHLKAHVRKVHLREVSVEELLRAHKDNRDLVDLMHDQRKPFVEC